MRRTIIALGTGLTLSLTTTAALAAQNGTTAADAAAQGPAWCGFKDKAGSAVRCGYSSESDCKQAVGEPGAICIVDPYLTERRRSGSIPAG